MKTKFTPGPWVAGLERMGDPDKCKVWAVSLLVASAKSIWIPQEVQEANANLIAAAPEMYEALRRLMDSAEDGRIIPEWLIEQLIEVKRVLAKVDGGKQ